MENRTSLWAPVMTNGDDFEVKLGRIGGTRKRRSKRFVALALAAAERAGGLKSGSRKGSKFGRGRSASLAAGRWLTNRSRLVTVKARVVRHRGRKTPLGNHITYLERSGVTRDGERGHLFNGSDEHADGSAFAERCADDRHHFRFIVSPEDAAELADLKSYTRDLMSQAERDLGTKLDWAAIDHWDTEHPHIHVLVRGRTEDGEDLVISRDYIAKGLRGRAAELATEELGQRTDLEISRNIIRQIEADRWTSFDAGLAQAAGQDGGVIDLRPDKTREHDPLHQFKIGRMRKLERMGLAEPIDPGRWILKPQAEPMLRELGERGDIIKRMHRALGDARSASDLVLESEAHAEPIVGRLVERGLDDELKGSAYAIIDGVDGRAHHLRLESLDAAGDGTPGSIVEVRRFSDARGRERIALAVRSDLSLERQVTANGATWLDRRIIKPEEIPLADSGFGLEVRAAIQQRIDHLASEGLARRSSNRVVLASNLIATLRERELDATAVDLAGETALEYRGTAAGDAISGIYRRRLSLASGRFAMIDNGLGFQLVPWSPSLERHLGRQVAGVALPNGAIEWSFGRNRGLAP